MLKRSSNADDGRLPSVQAAQARVPTIAIRPRGGCRKGVTRSPQGYRKGATQVSRGRRRGVWQGSKARFCLICNAACYVCRPSRYPSAPDVCIQGEAPNRSEQFWLSAQCEPESNMSDGGHAMSRTALRSATQ